MDSGCFVKEGIGEGVTCIGLLALVVKFLLEKRRDGGGKNTDLSQLVARIDEIEKTQAKASNSSELQAELLGQIAATLQELSSRINGNDSDL